jgi:hypothetical protein
MVAGRSSHFDRSPKGFRPKGPRWQSPDMRRAVASDEGIVAHRAYRRPCSHSRAATSLVSCRQRRAPIRCEDTPLRMLTNADQFADKTRAN